MFPKLYVKKLSEKASLPKKGSKKAAGYDLSSVADVVIPARGKALIPTGLAISLPDGVYGRVAPRSGLALKHHLDVGAGVIDQDYRGEVGVILFNHGGEDYKVQVGDKIAQLILEKIAHSEVVEVDDLEKTERGEAGFGSSGKSIFQGQNNSAEQLSEYLKKLPARFPIDFPADVPKDLGDHKGKE